MTAPGTQRYQDVDLRIDPLLIGHAIAYAKGYEGEWDVMVAAREIVRVSGTLPLAVARTVLNCARSDPRYATHLPPPRSGTFVGAFPSPDGDESGSEAPGGPDEPRVAPKPRESPSRPQRRLRVVEEPSRRPFDLKVSWPKRYGHTRNPKPGRHVWHVLDPDRSRIRYFPEAEEDRRYHTVIEWICSGGPQIQTAVLVPVPPAELSMCRSCERLLEDEDLSAHEHFGPLQAWWNEHGRRTP